MRGAALVRTLFGLALGLGVASAAGPSNAGPAPAPKPTPPAPAPAESVFVCKGPGSKRYHLDKDCRGLSRCSTPVEKVTLKQARAMGRTLCGWED